MLISEDTYYLVEDCVAVEKLVPIRVKGKKDYPGVPWLFFQRNRRKKRFPTT